MTTGIYSWVTIFFVINPFVAYLLLKGRGKSLIEKMHLLLTLTMFSTFFLGLTLGIYLLCIIAACYFVMSQVMMRTREN